MLLLTALPTRSNPSLARTPPPATSARPIAPSSHHQAHKASTDKRRPSDSTLEFKMSIAQHAIESNHTIARRQTSVLTTTSFRYHLNLAEHAAIPIPSPQSCP